METRFPVHASEWKWVGYDFDYEIENTGTLEDRKSKYPKFGKKYKIIPNLDLLSKISYLSITLKNVICPCVIIPLPVYLINIRTNI